MKVKYIMKMTKPTVTVLIALRDALIIAAANGTKDGKHGDNYGYRISVNTKISTARVYAILNKLEHAGWVESWWAYASLRRMRKYYEFTPLGYQKMYEKGVV